MRGVEDTQSQEFAGNELERLITRAKGDRDILAVILFGSVARGEPSQDVDVCLVLDPEKLTSIDCAKKGLEYIAAFDWDIHLYHELPLYIQIRILREGRIVLVKDEDKLYELAITTSQLFEEFQPRYMRYLEGVAHG
jgi:predicted nucleotidyltransferase